MTNTRVIGCRSFWEVFDWDSCAPYSPIVILHNIHKTLTSKMKGEGINWIWKVISDWKAIKAPWNIEESVCLCLWLSCHQICWSLQWIYETYFGMKDNVHVGVDLRPKCVFYDVCVCMHLLFCLHYYCSVLVIWQMCQKVYCHMLYSPEVLREASFWLGLDFYRYVAFMFVYIERMNGKGLLI